MAPPASYYPRVSSLQNGTLIACAETPQIGKLHQISWFTSHDGGQTWYNRGVVVEDTWKGVDLANCFIAQSTEDQDEFVVAYRHHVNCTNTGGPIPLCSHYRLRVHASVDGGHTWSLRSTIADHNRTHAVWEPFLFHAPASSSSTSSPLELHVAYSRERPRPGYPGQYAQDVVQRVSADGGRTWAPGFAQIQTTNGSRNGMPQCVPFGGVARTLSGGVTSAQGGPAGGWVCGFEGFWGKAGWGSFTVQIAITSDPTATGGWVHSHLVYAPGDLPGTLGRKAGSPAVAVCPGSGRLAVAFITDDAFDGTPPVAYTQACQVRAMVSKEPLLRADQTLSFPERPQVTVGEAVPSLWPQMVPVPMQAPSTDMGAAGSSSSSSSGGLGARNSSAGGSPSSSSMSPPVALMTAFQAPLPGNKGIAAVDVIGAVCQS